MKKQGAIILGIGGDNSKGADGTFYEGVMTSGYPSAATENAVQASIVAAGYSIRQRRRRARPARSCRASTASSAWTTTTAAAPTATRSRSGTATATPPPELDRHANGTITIDGKLPGHHRRQPPQRHPGRAMAMQRRRQPAMAGRATAQLVNPASGKCLDDPNSNTANGTQLQTLDLQRRQPTSNGTCLAEP